MRDRQSHNVFGTLATIIGGRVTRSAVNTCERCGCGLMKGKGGKKRFCGSCSDLNRIERLAECKRPNRAKKAEQCAGGEQ